MARSWVGVAVVPVVMLVVMRAGAKACVEGADSAKTAARTAALLNMMRDIFGFWFCWNCLDLNWLEFDLWICSINEKEKEKEKKERKN